MSWGPLCSIRVAPANCSNKFCSPLLKIKLKKSLNEGKGFTATIDLMWFEQKRGNAFRIMGTNSTTMQLYNLAVSIAQDWIEFREIGWNTSLTIYIYFWLSCLCPRTGHFSELLSWLYVSFVLIWEEKLPQLGPATFNFNARKRSRM